jgi:hypothetical protein
MIARTGRKAKGAEATQNKLKKPTPLLTKPKTVTVRNTPIARIAVTAMCEVVVKLDGIRPRKLADRMKRNAVKMKGN